MAGLPLREPATVTMTQGAVFLIASLARVLE